MNHRFLPLAVSGAAALALVTPVSALAVDRPHSVTRADAAHDVRRSAKTETAAPSRRDGDVLRTTVEHRPRSVKVTLHYAALRRPGVFIGQSERFRTPSLTRDVSVLLNPETGRTQVFIESGRGQELHCRGIQARFDFAGATSWVSVPRRCLGNPAWVRVGGGESKQVSENTYYYDQSFRTGGDDSTLTLGPRVYR